MKPTPKELYLSFVPIKILHKLTMQPYSSIKYHLNEEDNKSSNIKYRLNEEDNKQSLRLQLQTAGTRQ
jgi:hypothetical protein